MGAQAAEDIPEEQYGFTAAEGTRSIAQALVHIALSSRFQHAIHAGERRCCTDTTGPYAHDSQARHLPMLYDFGRPSSVIRFRMLQARTASRSCPDGLHARRPGPMIDLYRKNAFSTRACRW